MLFAIPEGSAGVDASNYFYDVTSDGERFPMAREVAMGDSEEASPPERLVLVQNFTGELRRIVPVD